MTCKDVSQSLIDGTMAFPLQSEVGDHLRVCAHCRELLAVLTLPIPEASPSPASIRRIESRIVADLRPVRPMPSKSQTFAAFVVVFIVTVALGVFRLGAFAIAVMSPIQTAMSAGALAISSGLLASSLVNQMVPGSSYRISPRLLPLCVMLSLLTVFAVLFHFQDEQNPWAGYWACIRVGAAIGALAAVPLWFVLHRGTILSPAMTGAATGLFAGLVGATVLEIHCPNLNAWHILMGHLGVPAFGALMGLLAGAAAHTSLPGHGLTHAVVRNFDGHSQE